MELMPEFPGEWFNANPGRKPTLYLLKSILDDKELNKRVKSTWFNSSSFDEMLEFITLFIERNFRARLTED